MSVIEKYPLYKPTHATGYKKNSSPKSVSVEHIFIGQKAECYVVMDESNSLTILTPEEFRKLYE